MPLPSCFQILLLFALLAKLVYKFYYFYPLHLFFPLLRFEFLFQNLQFLTFFLIFLQFFDNFEIHLVRNLYKKQLPHTLSPFHQISFFLHLLNLNTFLPYNKWLYFGKIIFFLSCFFLIVYQNKLLLLLNIIQKDINIILHEEQNLQGLFLLLFQLFAFDH